MSKDVRDNAKLGNVVQSFAAWAGSIAAHTLTSIATKWGNMPRSLYAVLGSRYDAAGSIGADLATLIAGAGGSALVVTDGSVGPSDFNAGYISVTVFSPGSAGYVDGLYLDVTGFTDSAILTIKIRVKVGAGPVVVETYKQFTKGTAFNGTLCAAIDTATPMKAVATSVEILVQSDNAGDVAVTVPFTSFSR